jgi:hypothetical protein
MDNGRLPRPVELVARGAAANVCWVSQLQQRAREFGTRKLQAAACT